MIFYKITAEVNNMDVHNSETIVDRCKESAENLYHQPDEKCYVIVKDLSENKSTLLAAITAELSKKINAQKAIENFSAISNINFTLKEFEEISSKDFKRNLRICERHGFIESRDKLVDLLNIECDIMYKEYIVNNMCRSDAEKMSTELLYGKSMINEIERIYRIPNLSATLQHPVHYILRSDNNDECAEILNALISSLYNNNRLFSKRYAEVDVEKNDYRYSHELKKLYKLQKGGTVVIKIITETDADNEYYFSGNSSYIEKVMKIANQYSQDVLTIVVMPSMSIKETEALYKNTQSLFIEIKQENASGENAKKYLEYRAKKANIETNEKLFDGIDDRVFSLSELSEHFSCWHSDYLRSKLYPQYAGLKNTVNDAVNDRKGNAFKELEEMIGLTNAKKIIYNALDYYKIQKLYQKFGEKTNNPTMHMVFCGNPGTAKTTVARLFAQILKENDVITNGKLVEVGRADLIGKYVGHTAPLVKKVFNEAAGGVLFIDEAYSLLDEKQGMFGDEAINTIVQEMENHRNDTIVIFAGYSDEMKEFINRNPGLKSRIAFEVHFDDYSPDELTKIAKLIAKNKGNTLNNDVLEKLNKIFSDVVNSKSFGNGRYVRNIIEKAEMRRASRLAKLDFNNVTSEMLKSFIPEDFEVDTACVPEQRTIGFIC
ncbi:MAG: AAA family ATPase [Clostridia bacterium]|nr:AAA family ATPase [Clostridia bacterium]